MSTVKVIKKTDSFTINGVEYEVSWLRQRYCVEREKKSILLAELGITDGVFRGLVAHYGLNRGYQNIKMDADSFTVKGKRFSKEWLYAKYIVNREESHVVAKQIGVNNDIFFQICHFYGLSKQKERRLVFSGNKIVFLGQDISFDDIKRFYVEDKHNVSETIKKFNLTKSTFAEIVNHYGLEKTWNEKLSTRRNTMKKIYGKEYSLQIEEFKNKREKTCIKNWGSKDVLASAKWKKQRRDRLGYTYAHCAHVQNRDIWDSDQLFLEYLRAEPKKNSFDMAEFFNIDSTTVLARVHSLGAEKLIKWQGGTSHYEEEIYDMLTQEMHIPPESVKRHVRHGIFNGKNDRRELDFFLPDYKLGIEFNGDYWHSDAVAKYQDHNGRSRYHQQKSLDAEKAGVFVFHIFEYEWTNPSLRENIKNRLKAILDENKIKIPARKCRIGLLTKQRKKDFLNKNHIQGNDHSSICLGLFYNDTLYGCMSFVKPKTKYTWELSRFCSEHGCVIQGGASKLLAYFVKNYTDPHDTIVSYSDITKTKGAVYPILGFALKSINPPNYIWMNPITREIRTRYQEQKAGEVQRMHGQGYVRICDCGTKTWVYTVE